MQDETFSQELKRLSKRVGKFAVDVVYDRRRDFKAKVFAVFLKGLSYVFYAIVKLRYFLYSKRFFNDTPLGCLVIVVGNLTVGGTGKTPVVEKFARELTKRGRKVAILSRGYKSKSEGSLKKFYRWLTHGEEPDPKVVSDGKSIFLNSEIAGDEPYMLARNLQNVAVVVDKNRVKAGKYAIEHFGADTLILDDGFQYLSLRGNMNILLVDKTNPFGNKSLLPRGILREPVEHLKRASYIFLTKSDGKRNLELEGFVRKYNKSAEFIECSHTIKHLVEFHTLRQEPISKLDGKKVAYFCAIGSPESFHAFLKSRKIQIVYFEHFIDHHRFEQDELDEFFEEAKSCGAEIVMITEKDSVRIDQNYKNILPLYYTRLEIDILSGEEDFYSSVGRVVDAGWGAITSNK